MVVIDRYQHGFKLDVFVHNQSKKLEEGDNVRT